MPPIPQKNWKPFGKLSAALVKEEKIDANVSFGIVQDVLPDKS